MTKPKFTPGPWRVDADGNQVVSEIYHEICAGHGYHENTGEGFSCTGHMSQADANLIAAAPDMYAALEAMVNDDAFADLCAGIGEEPQWLKDARAALAKAGRQ